MNAAVRWLPLLGFVVLTSSIRADDKPAILTGGNFEVEVVADVPYYEAQDDDSNKRMLDLYLPKGHKDYPVLLFVHGGGWARGDRKGLEKLGRVFAKNGVGTVVISYRLTPQVQHPGHIEDVARAFAWTHKNIARHGGRPDMIFVGGHSAGGHLAALLATDETYLKAHSLTIANVKGVMPISGVYAIAPGKFTRVFGENEEERKKASPLTHVRAGLPPMLVLVAGNETTAFIKMADEFTEALQKAKSEAIGVKIAERTHASIIANIANEDDPATQRMLGFLAKYSNLKLAVGR
jgi:acetyl esterase/lipase